MTDPPDLDADTALDPVADGVWRGRIHRHWYIIAGANGGLIAAQATRAMQLAAPMPGQEPRSLTLHYLSAPTEGDIDWHVTVERGGRGTTFLSLRATAGDTLLALGLGTLNTPRAGQLEWQDVQAPAVPPADELPEPPPDPDAVPVLVNYQLRFALGDPPLSGAGRAESGGWMRTARPRPLDAIALAAYSDAWLPAAFPRVTGPVAAPTIDLTIHWRAPVPAGEHPWVLGRFWSERSWGGTWEENGELWSQDGTLLVQSRQLALLRAL